MYYTPEEAKEKWCPFARVLQSGLEASYNRKVGGITGSCMCLGPNCMAWRWEDGHKENDQGYCGLVGGK